ncbi:MAG: ABC transporter substrate-binding protein [Bacteroidales bacterium]|nr:ABC transporter substrate-binding protein [Bacteroidales bacterium]
MNYNKQYFLSIAVLIALATPILIGCRGSHTRQGAEAGTVDSLLYAEGLEIAYFSNFTRVSLRDPWDTVKTRKTYILAPKTDIKDNHSLRDSLSKLGILIGTPVERAVIYTSVHVAMAAQLGVLDQVCGVCEPQYITSNEVLDRINNHLIADLGQSTSPNVEKIIDLGCDVIIASPFENSGYGAAEKLGIPIVEAADYMEHHPLGRTEWVKFYGLLFGCKDIAQAQFASTMARYDSLKNICSTVSYRPSVVLERKWGQTWGVPAARSYIGTLHRDAGADYVFSDITSSSSVHMSFEQVFERGCDADYWLFKYSGGKPMTLGDLKREYLPYSHFKAYKTQCIYACNTLVSSYYDDITLHPDRILEDLMHIYHPELSPDYQMCYYFRLLE